MFRREALSLIRKGSTHESSLYFTILETLIVMIKTLPYLLLIIGLIVLFLVGNVYIAGVCITLGIVMILESIWPSVSDD
jgi:ABC-type methionine transport system permease subunit